MPVSLLHPRNRQLSPRGTEDQAIVLIGARDLVRAGLPLRFSLETRGPEQQQRSTFGSCSPRLRIAPSDSGRESSPVPEEGGAAVTRMRQLKTRGAQDKPRAGRRAVSRGRPACTDDAEASESEGTRWSSAGWLRCVAHTADIGRVPSGHGIPAGRCRYCDTPVARTRCRSASQGTRQLRPHHSGSTGKSPRRSTKMRHQISVNTTFQSRLNCSFG
jgi:hypothetical protein